MVNLTCKRYVIESPHVSHVRSPPSRPVLSGKGDAFEKKDPKPAVLSTEESGSNLRLTIGIEQLWRFQRTEQLSIFLIYLI